MDGQAKSRSLREVMSSYPTGVTIVAGCGADGDPYGLTVNSFTSVSLDPPLVLVCIDRNATSHDRLTEAGHFSISILSADQGDIAGRFAREPPKGRFDEVLWCPSSFGDPVIVESVASLDCSLQEVVSGGDHSILIGRVERASTSDRPALMFHYGRFRPTT